MSYRQFTQAEKKWAEDFQKIMAKAPKSLILFVGPGIYIHTLDPEGKRYMNGHGLDNAAPCISIRTKMEFDGGDY